MYNHAGYGLSPHLQGDDVGYGASRFASRSPAHQHHHHQQQRHRQSPRGRASSQGFAGPQRGGHGSGPRGKAELSIPGEGPAQMRKIFIGGLHLETTDADLFAYFSQWGPLVDCIVMREPHSKRSRGFGFVTFGTFEAVEMAMRDRPHVIGGKTVDSKRAIPREQMLPLHHSPMFECAPLPGCTLIVSGIDCSFHSVEALRMHFEQFGRVDQIEIADSSTASIVFVSPEDAHACASLVDHNVAGRFVRVALAAPADA